MYRDRPGSNEEAVIIARGDQLGARLGPILDVDHTDRFVSCKVNHPTERGQSGWVNVWTSLGGAVARRVDFAWVVRSRDDAF